MNNTTNQYTITIKSSMDRLWKVLASTSGTLEYMPDTKLISDWQIGSSIEYACYNPDGTIMKWNDQDMIWKGLVVEFEEGETFTIDYGGSLGLVSETYSLKLVEDGTEVTFIQVAVDAETAKNYDSGNIQTLDTLKKYLEA